MKLRYGDIAGSKLESSSEMVLLKTGFFVSCRKKTRPWAARPYERQGGEFSNESL